MNRFFLLLLILITALCKSQEAKTKFANFNTISFNSLFGLQEKTIYDVLEIDGKLYFGSNSGLYVFNGDSIKNFKLQGYPVEYTNLKPDPEGRIWFSNFNGQIFNFYEDSIRLFVDRSENTGANISFNLSYYPTMIIDGSKSLITINVNQKNAEVKHLLKETHPLIGNNSKAVFGLTSEINSDKHSFFIIEPGGKVNELKHFKLPPQKKINFLVQEERALIFNISDEDVSIYQISLSPPHELKLVKKLKAGLPSYNLFQKVNDSTVAYLSKTGFKLLNSRNWNSNQERFQLIRNSCSKYYPVSSGITLLATLNHGVQIIANSDIQNISWSEQELQSFVFTEDHFYFQDQFGELWRFNLDRFELGKTAYKGKNLGSLYYDPDSKKILASLKHSPYPNSLKNIFALSPIRFKKIVKAFGYNYGTYSHTLNKFKGENIFPDRYKRCRLIDFDSQNQTLFVDFIDGLHYKQSAEEEFKPFKLDEQKSTYVHSLKAKIGGGMWIFDTNQALYLVEGKRWRKFVKLNHDFHLIEEQDSLLILANESNLCFLNKTTKEVTYLNQVNGLLPHEILGLKLRDSMLWVVNPSGLQIINLNGDFNNFTKPQLSIVKVSVNEKYVNLDQLKELEHLENNISVFANTFHLASLGKEYLEYRLNSQEESWLKMPGNQSKIDFQQLAPGQYNLEIRACSSFGLCSESKFLTFTINQAWYNSTWFYLTLFVILIALAFLISKVIIQRNLYLEKLEREKEIADKERQMQKIKALQAQMNPHFVFNALNSIQDYILSNQKELASEYLADFADLIRSYLQQSKKDFIEIEEEANTLKEYLKLEKLRLSNDLDYKIVYNGNEELIKSIRIPVMLVQPFVENAIKHGLLPKKDKRKLLIAFSLLEDTLIIKIQDNGIGIKHAQDKPNKHGLAFGNKAIQDKVKLLNTQESQTISIEVEDGFGSSTSSGTTIRITIKGIETEIDH